MNITNWQTLPIDTADNSTTVTTKRTIVHGVYVNTVLSAHTVILKNGTETKYTLPASLPAGTYIPIGDALFESGLVVDPNDASTGNITVEYKEL